MYYYTRQWMESKGWCPKVDNLVSKRITTTTDNRYQQPAVVKPPPALMSTRVWEQVKQLISVEKSPDNQRLAHSYPKSQVLTPGGVVQAIWDVSLYRTCRGDPRIRILDQEETKSRHPFSSPCCTLEASAKAAASAGVRVMVPSLRAAVSKLHPHEAHSPRRCEETNWTKSTLNRDSV